MGNKLSSLILKGVLYNTFPQLSMLLAVLDFTCPQEFDFSPDSELPKVLKIDTKSLTKSVRHGCSDINFISILGIARVAIVHHPAIQRRHVWIGFFFQYHYAGFFHN